MGVLDTVNVALPRLRAAAESLMTDMFTVRRFSGGYTTDPDTGATTPVSTVIMKTKGKIQTSGGIASQVVTASGDSSNVGGNVPVWSLYIHFPVTVTGLRSGDYAECTASNDPDMVGRTFRLVNMQSEKTFATARRWNVQEMTEDSDGSD